MRTLNTMKNNYICNCVRPNFKKNYSYWEDRNLTTDEKEIISYLKNNFNLVNKNILHIGIGNSLFAKMILKNNFIYGISVSSNEINKGQNLNLDNYRVFLCDKFSTHFSDLFFDKKFDVIVDNNIKSYSCCNIAYNYFMENLFKMLNHKGILITSRKGMNWYKNIVPKLSFNLKRLFHYKLKEINGNSENIMTIDEAKFISNKYSLKLKFDEKICFFEK